MDSAGPLRFQSTAEPAQPRFPEGTPAGFADEDHGVPVSPTPAPATSTELLKPLVQPMDWVQGKKIHPAKGDVLGCPYVSGSKFQSLDFQFSHFHGASISSAPGHGS